MGKKSPSPPPAPDPVATANAQAAANKEAVETSYKLASYDRFGPGYSLTYDKNAQGVPTAQYVNLDPTQQALFDQQQQLGLDILTRGSQLSSGIPTDAFNPTGLPDRTTSLDYSGLAPLEGQQLNDSFASQGFDRGAVEQSLYDRSASLMEPGFERQQRRMEQRLADQGLAINSEAHDFEMDQLNRSQNETRQRMADQAVANAGAEQSRLFGIDLQNAQFGNTARQNQFAIDQALRNQGLNEQLSNANLGNSQRDAAFAEQERTRDRYFNEASASLGGSQVLQTPQAGGGPQYGVAPADVQGATYASYNAALNNYNIQNQQANSFANGLFGLGSAAIGAFSYSGYKEAITPPEPLLNKLAALPINEWQYKSFMNDNDRHIGPMAEDFAETFGVGDGITLKPVDMFGVLLGLVKELDAKVESLSQQGRPSKNNKRNKGRARKKTGQVKQQLSGGVVGQDQDKKQGSNYPKHGGSS